MMKTPGLWGVDLNSFSFCISNMVILLCNLQLISQMSYDETGLLTTVLTASIIEK